MVEIRTLKGAEIAPWLDDLAALRIAVFREFPYLYDGDCAYERRYLGGFAASPHAFVAGAFDGERLVGAATGCPLEDHDAGIATPLVDAGYAPDSVYYCAESVLLPAYRGRGLGHMFFDRREAQAREMGRTYSAFCAVVRAADHPARPPGYRPLDAFWRGRGYAPVPGALARLSWREIGATAETGNRLQFWCRRL